MKKILLVEDNLEVRENTAEILELANYDVVTAENGKVAVKKAREEKPDMILCDIMMPEMDGYGVLYLLSKDPDTVGIPFIFLTAKADRSDIRKGMNLGADDYLTKPFEEMELLDAIESRFKRSDIIRKEFSNDVEGLNAFLNEAHGKQVLQELPKDRKHRVFKRKETIFHEDEHLQYLYFIVRGKVKEWQINDDGKELITALHKPGEFIGYISLLGGMPTTDTASAIEETELALIPRQDFLDLINKDRDVAFRFIRMLANNVREKESKLLRLAYDSVRSRVADALLHLRDRYKKDSEDQFSIRISRDDLAGLVATATESLIRTLTEFKHEGLVSVSGREITVVNPDGLERIRQLY